REDPRPPDHLAEPAPPRRHGDSDGDALPALDTRGRDRGGVLTSSGDGGWGSGVGERFAGLRGLSIPQPLIPNPHPPSPIPRPRCSVGVMAHNEEANIGRLLDALLAQHLTTVEIGEIVVVASGCTDGTIGIVEEYRARDRRIGLVVQPAREGKTAAINLFLRQ